MAEGVAAGAAAGDMTNFKIGFGADTLNQLKQNAAQQMAQSAAAQRAYDDWLEQQRRLNSPSRMQWVPSTRPIFGQNQGYMWAANPAMPPGPAPDTYQPPAPVNPQNPIQRFAWGGFSRGGRALVGEQGPEIVDLPAGSQVTPNPYTTGAYNQTPYWQMGGGYGFHQGLAGTYDTPPAAPTYGPGYGAVAAVRPRLDAPPQAQTLAPLTVYADPGQSALYGSTARPEGYAAQAPVTAVPGSYVPNPSGVYSPTGTPYGSAPYPTAPGQSSYPTTTQGNYIPWELWQYLDNKAMAMSGLTGTWQGMDANGNPIGNPSLTYAARLGLGGMSGIDPITGMPTLQGQIAENTRQQNVMSAMGNTFGGTPVGYTPGRDNVLPSRQFNQFIDNSMSNAQDEAAWNDFVSYMQKNLEPTRFGIIMRGEMVGNPTKAEQALMAGMTRRRGGNPRIGSDSGV